MNTIKNVLNNILKKISLFQLIAWIVAIQFFTIVAMGHIPGFTDANGYLFGFYSVSPLVDSVHFFSGVLAALAASISSKWSKIYFWFISCLYGSDILVSLLFSRDITETGNFFYTPLGNPDFSIHNIIANTPHIGLVAVALSIAIFVHEKKR
jgi:hypothetical protein